MPILLGAFLLGLVTGLRSLTGTAVTSWAIRTGHLVLTGSWLAFAGNAWMPWLLSAMAIGELIGDKLPAASSRKAPVLFIARIVLGALCGIALGTSAGQPFPGAICGAVGAIAGTLGGYAARTRLTRAFGGKDLPVALCEDVVAIGTACAVLFSR